MKDIVQNSLGKNWPVTFTMGDMDRERTFRMKWKSRTRPTFL